MARRDTPGGDRNRDRADEGKAPRGRPPKDWPKDLPRTPVEADDVPRYPDEEDFR
jgi:hypothetical protein